MFKPITVIAVAAALSLQPAAAKLGGGQTVSDSSVQKQERRGVVAVVIDQVRFSVSTAIGHSAKSKESSTQYSYFYKRKECEVAKDAEAEDTEPAEAKTEEPIGPEPLYFGF